MADIIALQTQKEIDRLSDEENKSNDLYLRWIASLPTPFEKTFSKAMKRDANHLVGNFKVDLIQRAYWTGKFFSDWWSFLKNHHKTLGIFFAHWLSPFTTKGRIIVFYCGVCMAFVTTALLEMQYQDTYKKAMCEGTYDNPGCIPTDPVTASEKADESIAIIEWVSGLGVIVYMTVLKTFAMCLCCQRNGQCCRCLGDWSGGFIMLIQTLISTILLVIIYAQASETILTSAFLNNFIRTQWNSMGYDVIIVTGVFVVKWIKQKRAFGLLYEKALEAQQGIRVGKDIELNVLAGDTIQGDELVQHYAVVDSTPAQPVTTEIYMPQNNPGVKVQRGNFVTG